MDQFIQDFKNVLFRLNDMWNICLSDPNPSWVEVGEIDLKTKYQFSSSLGELFKSFKWVLGDTENNPVQKSTMTMLKT